MYSSEQYSIHRFSISGSSVRHFPERSWTVLAFLCFTVVKSFTSWYALLLLFFLRFSLISPHCFPIQFSLALAMHLWMLLFTSLYFSDLLGSNHFFLSFLLLSHRSRISAVTQFFFFFFLLTMFAKQAVSVTAVLKVVIIESISVFRRSWWLGVQLSRLSYPGRFPTHWDLSAFRDQTWVLCVLACWLFFFFFF